MNKINRQNHILCPNLACSGFPDAGHAVWKEVEKYPLVDTVSGETPLMATSVSTFRCDAQQALYLLFEGRDEEVLSLFRLHDEPLYRGDVFEAFIADQNDLSTYKELEVSPWDVHFDGIIRYDSEGNRHLMMAYDVPAWVTKTLFDRTQSRISSVWKMPYATFDVPPAPGVSWRVNFFRIDHSAHGEALQAWQGTGAPSFHVPQCFGYLDFV